MFAKRIKHGIVGGLVGGAVFGMMMAMMGMLPMIGKMVGVPNAMVGFLVHMVISASIGASFGVLAGPIVTGRLSGLVSGAVYGMIWWVLGPLTLMPLMMGMGLGANWSLGAAQAMLPSLMGHVIFGLLLGLVYSRGENCVLLKNKTEVKERFPLKAV
jgi:uncharacterized membrane protein YagU involved in acid resistance